MRTTKRFTPDLFDRFRRTGRGTGTDKDYIPWHRVSRSDPSSRGRSHLHKWNGRLRELLSDGEHDGFLFSPMVPFLLDVREQLPLSLDSAPHELALYDAIFSGLSVPSTVEIATQLGIKHPRVNGNGRSEFWTMTTDLVLTIQIPGCPIELLPISFKQAKDLEKRRTSALQRIEQAYWQARCANWLLITRSQYDERVALTLRNTMPWGLGEIVTEDALLAAIEATHQWYGHSLTNLLQRLAESLGSLDHAQRAFWQAVWTGRLPIELRRGWRPHIPIQLVSQEEFWSFNPIVSRRSAWI